MIILTRCPNVEHDWAAQLELLKVLRYAYDDSLYGQPSNQIGICVNMQFR